MPPIQIKNTSHVAVPQKNGEWSKASTHHNPGTWDIEQGLSLCGLYLHLGIGQCLTCKVNIIHFLLMHYTKFLKRQLTARKIKTLGHPADLSHRLTVPIHRALQCSTGMAP